MVSDSELDSTLMEAMSEMALALGTAKPERREDGGLCLREGALLLCFRGVPRLNEIQPSIFVTSSLGDEPYSVDTVQEWLGEAARAYMFNNGDILQVSRQVADFARRIIGQYRSDPVAAKAGLLSAGRVLAQRFNTAEIRERAKNAWAQGDYALVKSSYEELGDELTPVERKRLSIAMNAVA